MLLLADFRFYLEELGKGTRAPWDGPRERDRVATPSYAVLSWLFMPALDKFRERLKHAEVQREIGRCALALERELGPGIGGEVVVGGQKLDRHPHQPVDVVGDGGGDVERDVGDHVGAVDRLALLLYYESGKSYRDVAAVLGIPPKHVASLMARARAKPARVLEAQVG